MSASFRVFVVLLGLLASVALASETGALEPEKKFALRPGVPGEVSAGLDGFVCKFEFTVEGGSLEDWNIAVGKSGDQYTCTIGRPTSYLYFKKWFVSLTKAEIVSVETVSNGERIEASTANKKNNRLRNKKGWEGNMSGISIVAKKVENVEL